MENATTVGKALYMEFRRGDSTQQVLFTPEGINLSGRYVPMTTYRRRISETAPRKAWKQMSTMFISEKNLDGSLVQLGKEHALSTVQDRLSYSDNLFRQLLNQGWALHKQPITVEVTPEDLEDVRAAKTPYKILGRVTRCRRTLDFGEALFVPA
jgi:hypothetical protein